HAEFITRLQQCCLLTGIRFDTLPDIENGSEAAWRKENSDAVMFFGFGGLQIQQINKVLTVLEQALAQP
ncbi:PLP-dependent aminotransferase family protein, partial [Klebsiella pneumoniae]